MDPTQNWPFHKFFYLFSFFLHRSTLDVTFCYNPLGMGYSQSLHAKTFIKCTNSNDFEWNFLFHAQRDEGGLTFSVGGEESSSACSRPAKHLQTKPTADQLIIEYRSIIRLSHKTVCDMCHNVCTRRLSHLVHANSQMEQTCVTLWTSPFPKDGSNLALTLSPVAFLSTH